MQENNFNPFSAVDVVDLAENNDQDVFKASRCGELLGAHINHNACFLKANPNFIIITGSVPNEDQGMISNFTEYFDIETKESIELPPLNEGRYSHSSCSIDNKVYVFGGFICSD